MSGLWCHDASQKIYAALKIRTIFTQDTSVNAADIICASGPDETWAIPASAIPAIIKRTLIVGTFENSMTAMTQ